MSLKNRLSQVFLNKRAVLITFFLTLNAINIPTVINGKMNNWKIFRYAYYHLTSHQDMYAAYPDQYFDLYLYSPPFGVLFAPFSLLPFYIGYFVWNNFSVLIIPLLIFRLKGITDHKKYLICYIALIEILTCMQGTQTNVMIAALMLLAFISFEEDNYWIAAFAIAAGTYIKIYPIITASLFLLYPHKLKFLLRLALAFILLGALPLLFVSLKELLWQYKNWFRVLATDQKDNYGKISLTGLFQVYFNISDLGKVVVQAGGVILFCTMYIRRKLFSAYYYRLFFLAALLIWVVIFNHASEVYGYAIAILGVGFWYVHQPPSRAINIFILIFIFFATILSIDPTPRIISKYIYEHSLKAIPYTFLFLAILFQMLFRNSAFFRVPPQTALSQT
jgi:hypothetical protein